MKEDIDTLDLTEEDFQALLEDIKKRREKYRESLDEEKKEDKIMDKNYYDYVLEKNITQREADTDGIYIISNYLGPVTTLDTIKSCDCIATTSALNTIHIVNKYNTDINELMKKNLTKGEIFIDEDTQEVYIVDKGDLETYWLKIGREEAYKKEIERLERLERNPWLDEDFDFS